MSSTNQRGKNVVNASSGYTTRSQPASAACRSRSSSRPTTASRVSSRWIGPNCPAPTRTVRVMGTFCTFAGLRCTSRSARYSPHDRRPGALPRPRQGPRRRPLLRAAHGRRHGPRRPLVARPLQPRVPRRVRRVAAPVPAHPPARARRLPAAQHRSHGHRHLLHGRAQQRRLVHHQLSPHVRDDAHAVPRLVPARRLPGARPALRRQGLRPPAEPHVSRRRPAGCFLMVLSYGITPKEQ